MATFPRSPTRKTTRRCFALDADDMELLRRVRDRLSAEVGRCSYVAAVPYGLRLAAAHLDAKAGPPVALDPGAPSADSAGARVARPPRVSALPHSSLLGP